jgi:hypothetical protein
MHRIPSIATSLALATHALPTFAQDQTEAKPRELGLNPGAPRQPGGMSIGPSATTVGTPMEPNWHFQFHGYLAAPLAVGVGDVERPAPGQRSFALHTPPQAADTWGAFEYGNVIPGPWVQLNFSYGNAIVTGTVVVAAYSISGSSPWFNPGAQLGINKAFLTFHPGKLGPFRVLAHTGSFNNSYGHMGIWDNGRYETPLVAGTSGVGETITLEYPGSGYTFQIEQGFKGHLDLAPQAIRDSSYTGSTPVGSRGTTSGSSLCPLDPPRTAPQSASADQQANLLGPAYGWPDCNVGSSFVADLHAGLGLSDRAHFALHWLHAWSQDDRTPRLPAVQRDPEPSIPPRAQPNGYIDVFGGDVRLYGKQYGDLYLGVNHTRLTDAATVGNVINVLNAGGGPGLSRFWLGPDSRGNGNLTALGLQYELSIAKLLYHPRPFWGEGPDVKLAFYGMYATTSSPDEDFDGVSRLKLGTEVTYSPFAWFAAQGRFDHISPNLDDSEQTRSIATLRLIGRSSFVSHERVWLQYSRWFNSDGVVDPFTGTAPSDLDMLAFVTTMWW